MTAAEQQCELTDNSDSFVADEAYRRCLADATPMRNGLPSELIRLDEIACSLAETRSLKEVKAVRDKAEAARHYARGAALGLKIQNQAAELKLRAERRAGQLLKEVVVHGGDRRSHSRSEEARLSDLGIDHNQSARWQREAAIPEDVFLRYIAESNSVGKEITSIGFLRLERAANGKPAKGSPPRANNVDPIIHTTPGESVSEIFDELQNHRNLLEQILAGALNGNCAAIRPPEQRLVLRLLHDIKDVLECLRLKWAAGLRPKEDKSR